MIYAQKVALEHNVPLHVCFALPEKFREATIRQYGFMLKGLQDVEKVSIVSCTSQRFAAGGGGGIKHNPQDSTATLAKLY